MKIVITFFTIMIALMIVIPVAALSPTGLVLTPGYAVVVDDLYVPQHPEWYQPGVTIEGSKLALRDSDGTLYIVKGFSYKNALPPWDGHSYIALIKHSSWGDQELARVEVEQDRNYKVKAYFRDNAVVVVYSSSDKVLGTFTPRSSYLDVYAEACTPRLERIYEGDNSPIITTWNEFKLILIGLGLLTLIALIIVLAKKR